MSRRPANVCCWVALLPVALGDGSWPAIGVSVSASPSVGGSPGSSLAIPPGHFGGAAAVPVRSVGSARGCGGRFVSACVSVVRCRVRQAGGAGPLRGGLAVVVWARVGSGFRHLHLGDRSRVVSC
jgi:hypothetical protein